MKLPLLIDHMIDNARKIDPDGAYSILVGPRPVTETDWVTGKTSYRGCRVVQTRLVPNYTVVLAPSPDNFRVGDLIEYHGKMQHGEITRYTLRHRASQADLVGGESCTVPVQRAS